MKLRGSAIVYCPECNTPHYANVMRRVLGGWQILCKKCGAVPWRARSS